MKKKALSKCNSCIDVVGVRKYNLQIYTNCLRNTNNGNGDMINRNEMKGAT